MTTLLVLIGGIISNVFLFGCLVVLTAALVKERKGETKMMLTGFQGYFLASVLLSCLHVWHAVRYLRALR